ncbi:MAG: hypothetical protein Q9160_006970 [Pyrenula sp. 1 TL-2023]
MAPAKSPPLAFEPSPETIFADANKENLSPLSIERGTKQVNGNNHERQARSVHFSPMSAPGRRAQSLATDVPMLEPVSSASQVPRSLTRSRYAASTIDIDSYIQQSRSLLTTQRQRFENQRIEFEQERALWNTERSRLEARIAEFEDRLEQVTGAPASKRRFSNDMAIGSGRDSIRASFSFGRGSSNDSIGRSSSRVWERPTIGATATRVFSDEPKESKPSESHLPSIAESPGTTQQKENKVSSPPQPRHSSRSTIPIEQIDSTLDGINLKSTGLAPYLFKTIASPTTLSPTQEPVTATSSVPTSLRIDIEKTIQSPFPENLIKDAGHTPMAREVASDAGTEGKTDFQSPPSLDTQHPYSPGPTMRPPTERSNSYFPESETVTEEPQPDEDPMLKGPLTMGPDGKDTDFLNVLDKKLEAEAHRTESGDKVTEEDEAFGTTASHDLDDGEIKLRIKRSTNFGSAWGSKTIGKDL